MLLTYELLGLAVLYVVWTIYKAVMDRSDRRKEFEIQGLSQQKDMVG